MNQVVLPAMTYGSETWALTNRQKEKLKIAQRCMERSLIGITRRDRWTNEEIRKTTKVCDIAEKIDKLKWQWAGHIARMKSERWTKKMTEWIPRGEARQRGRQKTRWRDEIVRRGGVNWMQKAQDRERWKRMWRPSTCSGRNGGYNNNNNNKVFY